ncbi:MAG: hypothetical protein M3N95_04645 [Actinomycetota bacterium]|nr:hypothetical protein [Actinomycetota bacterium]
MVDAEQSRRQIIGAPALVSANGRTDVFGEGTNNVVWVDTCTGSGWSSLSGDLSATPGAG